MPASDRVVVDLPPLPRFHRFATVLEGLTYAYAVRDGAMKTYSIDADGREHVLGFHLPGEIIGFDAIHERVHRANVVALDTSSVCGLSFDSVTEMARQLPKLQDEMAKTQEELGEELLTVTAGGGMITVEITGQQEFRSIKIEPDAVDPDDVEKVGDDFVLTSNSSIRVDSRSYKMSKS